MQKPVRGKNVTQIPHSGSFSGKSVGLGQAAPPASVLLEQRVHVQQVVLDGGPGHGPAGASPQPTHGHGGLRLWVLDVVSFVQNHPVPGDPEERSRCRRSSLMKGKQDGV